MRVGRSLAAMAAAVGFLHAPVAAANPVFYNGTGEVVKVYWRHADCTGTAGGFSNVCSTDEVPPGGRTESTYWPAVARLSCMPDQTWAPGRDKSDVYTIYDLDLSDSLRLGLTDVTTGKPLVDPLASPIAYPNSTCFVQMGEPPVAAKPMAEVVVGEGFWGTWRKLAVCPHQTRARGYQVRVEKPTGDGDETALNSVRLLCGRDGVGAYGVESASGYFGDWSAPVYCSGSSYITGASLRVQPKQGSDRDDTAANDVQFVCGTEKLHHTGGGTLGTWGSVVSCPADKPIVCGLTTRLEPHGGKGVDDTAMNGLRLECCAATMAPEADGNGDPRP